MVVDKKKILFVGEGTSLAHIVRPLVLAKHLEPGRFDISFACAPQYQWLVDQSGFEFHALPTMSAEEFQERLTLAKPLYEKDRLKEYIENELVLLRRVSPDLVVSDLRLSLSVSAPVYQLPHIALANAHWSPLSTQQRVLPDLPVSKFISRSIGQPFFELSYPLVSKMFHAKGLNELRKSYHLPVLQSLEDVYTMGEWTLFVDIPSLAPTRPLPDYQKYIGPILEMPYIPLPEWWDKWPKDRPVIFVNLGSSGNLSVMDNIIRSLSGKDFTVLLATANRIKRVSWPANFFTAPYLPGHEAARLCQLMLFNGGAGSAYQPLSCGVPVIGFPSNMDQYLCIARIEACGAGKMIPAPEATEKNILSAVQAALTGPGYKQKAEELAGEIKMYDAVKNFCEFIDRWDRGDLKRRL